MNKSCICITIYLISIHKYNELRVELLRFALLSDWALAMLMPIVIVLNKTVSAIYHWFLREFVMKLLMCFVCLWNYVTSSLNFLQDVSSCYLFILIENHLKSITLLFLFPNCLSFVVFCSKFHLIPTNIYNEIKLKRYVFNVQRNHLSWSDVWFMFPLIILYHSIYFSILPANAITIPEESGKEWQQQDIYWNTSSLLTFLLCDKSAELSG